MSVIDMKFLPERSPRSGKLLNDLLSQPPPAQVQAVPSAVEAPATGGQSNPLEGPLLEFFKKLLVSGQTKDGAASALAKATANGPITSLGSPG